MLVSESPHAPNMNLRTPNANSCTPNAKANIVCVRYARVGFPLQLVMLFVSISFTLGNKYERDFWWNMGFTISMGTLERH